MKLTTLNNLQKRKITSRIIATNLTNFSDVNNLFELKFRAIYIRSLRQQAEYSNFAISQNLYI